MTQQYDVMSLVFSIIVLTAILGVFIISIIQKIKLSNLCKVTSSTSSNLTTLNKKILRSEYESELLSRDCIRKLSDFTNSHVWNIQSELFDMVCNKLSLSTQDKNNIELIIDLIANDLQCKLLNNFTENHIGNTDNEISIYTKIRTKEYMMRVISIADNYTNKVLSSNEFLVFIKQLPDEFLYNKLFTIYRDGKLLEKSIKSEFNK